MAKTRPKPWEAQLGQRPIQTLNHATASPQKLPVVQPSINTEPHAVAAAPPPPCHQPHHSKQHQNPSASHQPPLPPHSTAPPPSASIWLHRAAQIRQPSPLTIPSATKLPYPSSSMLQNAPAAHPSPDTHQTQTARFTSPPPPKTKQDLQKEENRAPPRQRPQPHTADHHENPPESSTPLSITGPSKNETIRPIGNPAPNSGNSLAVKQKPADPRMEAGGRTQIREEPRGKTEKGGEGSGGERRG